MLFRSWPKAKVKQRSLLHWSLGCPGQQGVGLGEAGPGELSGVGPEKACSLSPSLRLSAPSTARRRGPRHHRPDHGVKPCSGARPVSLGTLHGVIPDPGPLAPLDLPSTWPGLPSSTSQCLCHSRAALMPPPPRSPPDPVLVDVVLPLPVGPPEPPRPGGQRPAWLVGVSQG